MWRIGGTIIRDRDGSENAGIPSSEARSQPSQSYGTITAADDINYDTDGSRVARGRQGKGGTGTDEEPSTTQLTTSSAFDPANRTIRFPDEAHDSSQGGSSGLRGRAATAAAAGEGGGGQEYK